MEMKSDETEGYMDLILVILLWALIVILKAFNIL